MRLRTTMLVLVPLLCALGVEAQVLTGSIIGVVRDESRAVLPGVSVTVESPSRPSGPLTAVTNDQGEYRLTALEPGIYTLTVTLGGFSTYRETDLRVTVGGTIERNVALGVAALAETITVSGASPVIDSRQTGISTTITSEVVENVPHSRIHVAGLMATLPGVSAANYNRLASMNVMGSPANELSYMQDGILSNSVKSGGFFSNMESDGVEELQAVTLGASVEYQQAQGGVLNVVGKTGTNRYRFDGTVFWQPHGLTSAPIKLDCNCPSGQTGFKWYIHHDYSFHAGGPILTDRLWFFTGATNFGINHRNPGAPDTPEEYRWNRYNIRTNTKANWKINDKLSYQQVFYYDWWEYTLPEFPTRTTPLEALDWYVGEIRDSASELTATLSSSAVLTARYVIHYFPEGHIGFGPEFTRNDITTPARVDNFTGVTSGNMNRTASTSLPKRDDIHLKINKYISGSRISHNVRFGFQWSHGRSQEADVWPGGVRYLDLNGQPDQAEFTPPASYVAVSKALGFWAEDELNIGQRLTIVPGLRFDRMKAISPEVPGIDGTSLVERGGPWAPYYSFRETDETIAGLGDLYTWNKVSPRVGINLKLTDDGRTILRATAGRYYRPIFLNDYLNVHPGIATTTLARWDPQTASYSTIISVTDPRANIAVDPNIRAPWTDQFSIGIDRELMRNVGMSVSYVHKRWGDQIGWVDTGGVYGTQTVSTPNGEMEVFPLLNNPSERRYLRTNPPGFFNRYNGLILQLAKRHANRWMASVGYSYGITEGLQPTGTVGRDPNDLINLTGRQTPQDRPHLFNVTGMYEVPKIDAQVSANLQLSSGLPYGRQIQVRLPQGLRSIYFDPPGSVRTPSEQWLHVRIGKDVLRRGDRRIEIAAELRNALNETSIANLITQVASSPNFGLPASWAYPRRLAIMAKVVY